MGSRHASVLFSFLQLFFPGRHEVELSHPLQILFQPFDYSFFQAGNIGLRDSQHVGHLFLCVLLLPA